MATSDVAGAVVLGLTAQRRWTFVMALDVCDGGGCARIKATTFE